MAESKERIIGKVKFGSEWGLEVGLFNSLQEFFARPRPCNSPSLFCLFIFLLGEEEGEGWVGGGGGGVGVRGEKELKPGNILLPQS